MSRPQKCIRSKYILNESEESEDYMENKILITKKDIFKQCLQYYHKVYEIYWCVYIKINFFVFIIS